MAVFPSPPLPPTGLPLGNSLPSAAPLNIQKNGLTSLSSATSIPETADALASLQPLALKQNSSDPGVSFPGLIFSETQTKSLIAHRFPRVDGASIENMGLNEATFSVKAILTNNIFPGKNEKWQSGNLFPNTFNQLVSYLQDNNPKILVHPLNGNKNVQVKSWSYQLVAKGPRDGAIIDIVFIETLLDSASATVSAGSPTSQSTQAATGLDNAIAALNPAFNPPGLSLSQFFGKLNALIRTAIALPGNTVAALNSDMLVAANGVASIVSAVYTSPALVTNSILQTIQQDKQIVLGATAQALNETTYNQDTFNAVQSLLALNSGSASNASQVLQKAQTSVYNLMQHYVGQGDLSCSPVIEACRQYLYQLQQMATTVPSVSSNQTQQYVTIDNYITQSPITWMQLSKKLNNTIDDLMNLNQDLLQDLWLQEGVTVQYYQQ